MTNHPTQGLQDMTLDLATYSAEALAELQTRIEEEKTKRERKVPFEVFEINPVDIQIIADNEATRHNLYLRLSAEAKLRAAGGGSFQACYREHCLIEHQTPNITVGTTFHTKPHQGVIYFNTTQQALSAYATLTPDEQAAIFGFGEG